MNELLSCEQMARADAWVVGHGVPATQLMAQAGRAVFEVIAGRFEPCPVLVLCGPGNNGGDGYVVATLLEEAGWPVQVASNVTVDSLKGEALHHARLWLSGADQRARSVWPLELAVDQPAALVVDALFGAGLCRPLSPEVSAVLQTLSARGLPIVAVDVPSGIHGDTGADLGAVPALLTVTFFRKKPGHVLMPGLACCGEVVVADIGITADALPGLGIRYRENSPALWRSRWMRPRATAHKYRRGHVVVLGGGRMVGAARLCARAAARVGAGLTTLAVPSSVWAVYAGTALSAMVHPLDDADESTLCRSWAQWLAGSRWSALALGPGAMRGLPGEAASSMRALVEAVLHSPGEQALVLDADALMAFEGAPSRLFGAIQASTHPVVLTPHEGEFRRLFGEAGQEGGKLALTLEAASRSGAVVLHKGADTVVASPDGQGVVSTNGPAWLATAGSGDVLTGLIAGLLGQGLGAFDAACAGAWVHGACGQAFGPGLIAEDLPEQMPGVLRELLAKPD